MISPDKIDFSALKEAVKSLNASGLIESTIKTVAIGKESLADLFIEAIEALSDEAANDLPEECVNLYNTLVGDEVEAEQAVAKEEKAPKEKKEKAPKEKKEKVPKEKKEPKLIAKDMFGSVIGSKSSEMNALIAAGTTYEEIMAKVGVTRTSAVNHVKFIEKERGVTIVRDGEKVKGSK